VGFIVTFQFVHIMYIDHTHPLLPSFPPSAVFLSWNFHNIQLTTLKYAIQSPLVYSKCCAATICVH
jgi:hypothetical protein